MKLKPRKKSRHEWKTTAARIKKAKKEARNA